MEAYSKQQDIKIQNVRKEFPSNLRITLIKNVLYLKIVSNLKISISFMTVLKNCQKHSKKNRLESQCITKNNIEIVNA